MKGMSEELVMELQDHNKIQADAYMIRAKIEFHNKYPTEKAKDARVKQILQLLEKEYGGKK